MFPADKFRPIVIFLFDMVVPAGTSSGPLYVGKPSHDKPTAANPVFDDESCQPFNVDGASANLIACPDEAFVSLTELAEPANTPASASIAAEGEAARVKNISIPPTTANITP
jgi:hypothetical protein